MLESLLDKGSEVSLIKDSVAQRLGLPIRLPKNVPQVKDITGDEIRVLGQPQITVPKRSRTVFTTVLVVPDRYLPTDTLLGMLS